MADLVNAIHAVLDADATLAASWTGGVYVEKDISPTTTSDAYDAAGYLKPTGLVMDSTDVPRYPWNADMDVADHFFQVWGYDDPSRGYTNIKAGLDRCLTLLNGQTVMLTAGSVLEMRFVGRSQEVRDDILKATAMWDRYHVVKKRS